MTHSSQANKLTSSRYKKYKSVYAYFIYLFVFFSPLSARESIDYFVIESLVRSCYENTDSCNETLFKIHNYQKNAEINKKYSCQTRLLGLEANLIMAANSNLKRKEAKSILDAIKKYC